MKCSAWLFPKSSRVVRVREAAKVARRTKPSFAGMIIQIPFRQRRIQVPGNKIARDILIRLLLIENKIAELRTAINFLLALKPVPLVRPAANSPSPDAAGTAPHKPPTPPNKRPGLGQSQPYF